MRISILFIFIFSCLSIFNFSQQGDNQILATVGNHNITLSEFNERYTNYLFSAGVKDNIVVREAILNNMINELLLYYYDSNEKIYSNKEYQSEIDWLWKQSLISYVKDQEVYAKINVTEEELREAFKRINEQIAARHLYASNEEEANQLYELLNQGHDFNTLAKQAFTDSVLKNNGGYLGYFSWGDLDPTFEEVAYSLQVGEISKPVKTTYGYSIIKVEGRFRQPILTEYDFQKKKSNLEAVLRMNKKRPAEVDFLNKIFNKEEVIFNEESISRIFGKLQLQQKKNEGVNSGDLHIISATYYEREYTEKEIEEKIEQIPYYHRQKIDSPLKLKVVIEGLLIQEILINLAKIKGFDKMSEVIVTYNSLRNNTFLKYKMNEILAGYTLPDSVIFQFYKDNIKYFLTPEEIDLQEIIVNEKSLADSLSSRIKSGEDFGKLARQYSIRKSSSENDGIIGFSPITKFGMFAELFWEAKLGEVLGPLRVEIFWGIFRVNGKKESKPIDFEFVKHDVEKAAKFNDKQKIVNDYIKNIRYNMNIIINKEMLLGEKISR